MLEWAGLFGGLGQLAGGAANLFRSGPDLSQSQAFAREQLQFQRDAAQMGIRWRVADAQAAGIHPLYAMGAQNFNPSPVPYPVGDASADMGASLSNMGQGISRAIQSTQSKEQRESQTASQIIADQQTIERGALQNDLLRIQLAAAQKALTGADQIGPPLPTSGRTGVHEMKPNEITTSQPNSPSIAAGPPGPVTTFHRSGTGLQAFPAKGVQGLDDMDATNALGIDWLVRNRLNPNFGVRDLAPTMDQVRAHFPNATGVKFDTNKMLWVPTYGDGKRKRGFVDEWLNLPPLIPRWQKGK